MRKMSIWEKISFESETEKILCVSFHNQDKASPKFSRPDPSIIETEPETGKLTFRHRELLETSSFGVICRPLSSAG